MNMVSWPIVGESGYASKEVELRVEARQQQRQEDIQEIARSRYETDNFLRQFEAIPKSQGQRVYDIFVSFIALAATVYECYLDWSMFRDIVEYDSSKGHQLGNTTSSPEKSAPICSGLVNVGLTWGVMAALNTLGATITIFSIISDLAKHFSHRPLYRFLILREVHYTAMLKTVLAIARIFMFWKCGSYYSNCAPTLTNNKMERPDFVKYATIKSAVSFFNSVIRGFQINSIRLQFDCCMHDSCTATFKPSAILFPLSCWCFAFSPSNPKMCLLSFCCCEYEVHSRKCAFCYLEFLDLIYDYKRRMRGSIMLSFVTNVLGILFAYTTTKCNL